MVPSPKRVMIVDDSQSLRKITRGCVESYAALFKIYEAPNGAEAERILQEQMLLDEPIELILLDWHMPELDGLGFLKKIRAAEPFKKYPTVIMLSAETFAEQISKCHQFGISSYVIKPFSRGDIHRSLEVALRELEEYKHAV